MLPIIIFIVECFLIFLLVKFVLSKKMEKHSSDVSDNLLIKRLFKFIKPHLGKYVIGILIIVVETGLFLISPLMIGEMLKEIGKDSINFSRLVLFFVLGVGFSIISDILRFIHLVFLKRLGESITYDIRQDLFAHIQSLSHNQLHNIPTGTLVTRCTNDVKTLSEFFANLLISMIQSIFILAGVLGTMFALDVQLGLIILDIAPVIVALTLTFRTIVRDVHRKVRTEVSNMNAFLSENITGIKITQVFNQEKKKYDEFDANNNRLMKASLKEIFTFGIFRPSIYLTYILTVLLILVAGARRNIDAAFIGVITYDTLYVFYEYIGRFFNPIQNLADSYNRLQSTFASAEKIYSILDIVPEIVDDPDAVEIDLIGNIEFKDVWFAYEKDEWILKGISFKIEKGQAIAFVGATGAGKTTILSLITRCYDIQKGQILVDGIDIKKIKISSLRSQIGQMLQDVFLFSGTIADNIRLNDEKITDEEINNACDEVNASYFINKNEKGIYQEVLERGNNLSMGERQLISFARTIVHKPKLVILDEATSNIDTETELIIQNTLEKVIEKHTTIMVAHRLSTIQHADMIYVFEKGHILENGNHQELIKARGRYYKLYKLQFEKTSKC